MCVCVCKTSTQPHLGCEHVFDTIDGPVQSDTPDQVDKEDQVGEGGGEVHHLQIATQQPGSKFNKGVGQVESYCCHCQTSS